MKGAKTLKMQMYALIRGPLTSVMCKQIGEDVMNGRNLWGTMLYNRPKAMPNRETITRVFPLSKRRTGQKTGHDCRILSVPVGNAIRRGRIRRWVGSRLVCGAKQEACMSRSLNVLQLDLSKEPRRSVEQGDVPQMMRCQALVLPRSSAMASTLRSEVHLKIRKKARQYREPPNTKRKREVSFVRSSWSLFFLRRGLTIGSVMVSQILKGRKSAQSRAL